MDLTQPDSRWSWIVMVAVFGSTCIAGYFQWAGGLIRLIFMERFQASSLETSWISASFLSLLSFAGPVASILIHKYSCRISMMIGALILSTGVILTAFMDSLIMVFFTFGVLGGIGTGICYNTGLIFLALNFQKKLNIASGIALSGAGVGPFILTPAYQLIFESYGYMGYFMLLGGLALQNFVVATSFKKSAIEARIKIINKKQNKSLKQSVNSYLEIVKNSSMMCLCLSVLLLDISVYLVYIHFPEYCILTGSTTREVSTFLSLAGASSCVIRILFGLANNSQTNNEFIMLFGVYSLLGLATILFPIFSFTKFAKILYSCLLGGYSGCCWVVLNAILTAILGHEKLAHGIGYIMIYVAIGTFIGPPLAGFIVGHGGTYRDSFTLAGFLFIGAAFFCLFSKTCQKEATHITSTMEDVELNVEPDEKDDFKCDGIDEKAKLQPD